MHTSFTLCSFIGFIVLALGLVTGLVTLLIKTKHPVRIVLSILAGLVLLAILMQILAVARPVMVRHAELSRHQQNSAIELSKPTDSSNSASNVDWTAIAKGEFEPDVYPSLKAAAIGASLKVLEGVVETSPALVIIGNIERTTLDRVASAIKEKHPKINLRVTENTGQTDRGPVYLQIHCIETPATINGTERIGSLEVIYNNSSGPMTRQVQFMHKPWADDFATYSSSIEGRDHLLAVSASPSTSPAEVHRKAIDNAVAQLEPMFRDRLDKMPQSSGLPTFSARYEATSLSGFIRSQLQRSVLIEDCFVQRYSRPYGDIWKESLLIDAKSINLDNLARGYNAGYYGARLSWARLAASTAGMIALICAVYAFANAATRGYYTWTLRVVGVMLAAGMIFLLHYLG